MPKIGGLFSLLVVASCAYLPSAAAFRPSGTSSSRLVSVPISPLTPTNNDLCSSSSSRTTSTILFMGKSGGSSKKKKKSGGAPASKGFATMGFATDSPIDRFPYAGSVRPGTQSPQRRVVVSSDVDIVMPDYALDGRPKKGSNSPLLPWVIEVKKPEEIVKMRKSGKLARHILDLAGRAVKPGITTDEIDNIVHEAILEAGAYPCTYNNDLICICMYVIYIFWRTISE